MTNSGDFDAVTRYYYDGQKIIETRHGAGESPVLYQQFIHGTRYIDELVMVRVKDKGDLYVHQDANWNVIGLTDLGGSVVERYVYTPYGEVTVHDETGYGDRDSDGDVDATDKGTPGSTCTGTVSGACRILDLDFDGDYDNDDATLFDSLPQGLARHPGRTATAVDQPFGHQGLLFEPEIGSYQNRARQYDPAKRRFAQRDPLGFVARNSFSTRLHYSDGPGLYGYATSSPPARRDPFGLACTVKYDCQLVSESDDDCEKDCEYACTETSRMDSFGGEIDCTDERIPSVNTYSRRTYGGWRCCCFDNLNPFGGCAKCPDPGSITRVFAYATEIPDCSRSTCREGCDLTAEIANVACGELPVGAKQACQAAVAAAQALCVDGCNAYCTLP